MTAEVGFANTDSMRRIGPKDKDAFAISSEDVGEKASAGEAQPRTAGVKADIQAVRDCLEGDGDAYAELVRRHQDKIAARMWRFTRDRHDHEELVQEVFVEAYFSLASYRGAAPLEHWLTRIATRVGYKYWKRRAVQRARPSVSIDHLRDLPTEESKSMDAKEAAEMLHDLLECLPPRDRLVLVLRYVEDRSIEETAKLTGWTQAMVRVQAWRARKKLKKLFAKAGFEVDQ
ncbi:RNA polymerase sigma factor [Thermodesulfobacteriota bacterium]